MPPIFGRARELAAIDQAVSRGLAGQGALVMLCGEPGIGKTRLAEHAAQAASTAGAQVSWGRCWEAGGAPAYWPWVLAFRGLGLATPFVEEQVDAGNDARFLAFDRAVQTLQQSAKQKPIAIVLDDLHAADQPSLLLLQLLCRGLKGHPLLVVATYREVEARQNPATLALLSKIAREGELLQLSGLAEADVEAWRKDVSDASAAAPAQRLLELSGGNPLFLRELLRLGEAVGERRLPDGIGSVLDEHVAHVPEPTRELLSQAAIFGREFVLSELAELAGVSQAEAAAKLAEARTADLLSEPQRGRYSFVHILVRDRLLDGLTASRRAELHHGAAELLQKTRSDSVLVAHHFIEGYPHTPATRVLEATELGVSRAMNQLAFEAGAALGERALETTRAGASQEVCRLLVVIAEAWLRAGDLVAGKRRSLDAAEMARALGDGDLQARAALAYGAYFATSSVDATMVELLENALAAVPETPSTTRARLLARLASALVPPRPQDIERVMELGRDAVAMARSLGDEETLLYALQYGGSGFGYMVSGAERWALVEELATLARKLNHRPTLVHALGFHAAGLLERGRRAEAMQVLKEWHALLAEFPQTAYRWRLHASDANMAVLDGDMPKARAAIDELWRAAKESGVGAAFMAWGFVQFSLAHGSKDPSSIAPVAPQVLETLGRVPTLAPYSGWVLAAVGRTAEARAALDTVSKNPRSFPWLIAAADAAFILQDRELAERFYAELGEHRFKNRIFWGPSGAFCLGPTARILGKLALFLGHYADAIEHFEEAVEFCDMVGSKPLAALSRESLDEARRAAAAAGVGPAPIASAAAASLAPENAGKNGPAQLGVLCLKREGDVWTLSQAGSAKLLLKDGKGVRYLEHLLAAPGRELHVLELIGSEERPADAGAVLDAKAKEQYRARLAELSEQREEAQRLGDLGRSERAQLEIDALADALASAVGLGGRDRVAASNVERARINVQRRLRDVLERISEQDAALGRYLGAALKTGTFCSFNPL